MDAVFIQIHIFVVIQHQIFYPNENKNESPSTADSIVFAVCQYRSQRTKES